MHLQRAGVARGRKLGRHVKPGRASAADPSGRALAQKKPASSRGTRPEKSDRTAWPLRLAPGVVTAAMLLAGIHRRFCRYGAVVQGIPTEGVTLFWMVDEAYKLAMRGVQVRELPAGRALTVRHITRAAQVRAGSREQAALLLSQTKNLASADEDLCYTRRQ